MVELLERHQVAFYLLAIIVGAMLSPSLPVQSAKLDHLVLPALGCLLFATFMSIPLVPTMPWSGALDCRFLFYVLVLNFAVSPVIVAGLLAIFHLPDPVAFVAALVLLTPCIDYVVVFAGLAGGNGVKLLAATPWLLLAQIVLVPLWLWAFRGLGLWGGVPVNFALVVDAHAGVLVALSAVLVPLVAALGVQLCAVKSRRAAGVLSRCKGVSEVVMVPLLMLVLFAVVAGNLSAVARAWYALALLVVFYGTFALGAVVLGVAIARVSALDAGDHVAVVFSGVTRNALVALPVVLAFSAGVKAEMPQMAALMPLVVVAQTLVELVVMVAMVRWRT